MIAGEKIARKIVIMPNLEALIGTVEILKKGTIEIRTYKRKLVDTSLIKKVNPVEP